MIFLGIFTGIQQDISNFFRDILWKIISMEMNLIEHLLDSLVGGVLSFGILDNVWIKDAFHACLLLMFIILPAKVIYEIVFAMVRDDDQGLDINKKIFGSLASVLLAVSLSTVVPLANNLTINVSKALLGGDYQVYDSSSNSWSGNGQKISNSKSDKNTKDSYAKELIIATFVNFGGMPETNQMFNYISNHSSGSKYETMDLGARRFYEYVTEPDDALKGYSGEPSESKERSSDSFFSTDKYDRWSFYMKWDVDGNGMDGSDDWDLMGKADYSQYKNATSSEEYDTFAYVSGVSNGTNSTLTNERAKKTYKYISEHANQYVWDFSEFGVIIGLSIFVILIFIITIQIAMRIIMIGFLYAIGPICCTSLTNYQNPQAFQIWKNSLIGQFVVNVTEIFMLQFLMNISGEIAKLASINVASIALYIGSFMATLSVPKYVQSMIGGYGQGIMESLQQLRGTVGAAWSMTGGMATSGYKAIMGRHNDFTGHYTGGIRGKIVGNKDSSGNRVGGVRGMIMGNKNHAGNYNGGFRGHIVGNRDVNGDLKGGLVGKLAGDQYTPTSHGFSGTVDEDGVYHFSNTQERGETVREGGFVKNMSDLMYGKQMGMNEKTAQTNVNGHINRYKTGIKDSSQSQQHRQYTDKNKMNRNKKGGNR